MLPRFRTLRLKLALLNLLVFGVIFTALSVLVMAVRERQLREDFDERLTDKAESMIDVIGHDARDWLLTEPRPQPRTRLNPFRFPGYYFQLRDVDGRSLERSANLLSNDLPFSAQARSIRFGEGPLLETLAEKAARPILGSAGRLQLITLYQEELDTPPFFLQVAHRLDRVEQAIHQLRRLFMIVIPAGLGLVGGASWWMARRSLAPIRRIARETRELTAARLDRRIPVPPGRDEVVEMTTTVNQMLDRLQKAFLAQERFIADASHELKTPLAVVLTGAQLLRQKERTPEEYDRFVADLQDQLRQVSRLIDSLLTLARADAGFPLAKALPVNLNELVTEATQQCEPLASHREVRLVPRLAPLADEAPEPVVSGDPTLLRAVLDNLIRNAIRHSPVEEAIEIEVKTDQDKHRACVAIRDRGPGIPPAQMEQVFERFFQAPRGGETSEGAGLGLAIAKGVVSLHGGSIHVANRPDGGCEFTLQLPLRLPD
ncbi:MAG: HAMP domain-containing histidine kinase [Phycisphaerales bacterium]|nr:MAG: HAMP domain-containing histidine kinase [Phycisphaerales bacterium]